MVQLPNYQWQPVPSSTSKRYYDVSLPQSPLAIRNRTLSRNAVPSGIVASRVLLLQKTGPGTPGVSATQSPSIAVKHHRGNSRIGFGRRVTARFGQPAVQNTKPDEEALAVDASHAFAGLNTPRKNHHEHHAVVEPHLRTIRSSTQIQLLAQPEHDGTSPAGKVLWKSKSYNPMRHPHNSLDVDVLGEVDPFGNKTDIIAQTSIFPLPVNEEEDDMYRRETNSRPLHTLASDNSFVTTSTIRRQSVRDLFNDYGIDRPAGLVSKHASRETEHVLQDAQPSAKCHLCGWVNSDLCSSCWRCGHRSCSRCDDKLGSLNQSNPDRNKIISNKFLEASKPAILPMKARLVEEEPVKHTSFVTPHIALNAEASALSRKSSSIMSRLTQQEMAQKSSNRTTPPTQILREQTSRISLLTGTRTTTKVKESPFLLADSRISPRTVHPPLPIKSFPSGSTSHDNHRPPYRLSRERYSAYSTSEGGIKEESSLHNSTSHLETQADRPIAPSLREKHHTHDETDNGYAADTSVLDEYFDMEDLAAFPTRLSRTRTQSKADTNLSMDTAMIQEISQPHSRQYFTDKPNSKASPTPRTRSHSSQIWQHLSTFHENQAPEFVECHGYPRTGHAQHDASPIDTGTVGECQHCLDDCPCAACRYTDHSVRCCIHADHQPMAHVHHTPQRELSTQDLVDITTSLSKILVAQPNSTLMSPRTSVAAPLLLQTTREQPQRRKDSNSKKAPLPRSKRSIQRKEGLLPIPPEKKSMSSVAAGEPWNRIVVEAVLNVGKSKPVIPIISMETDRDTADDSMTDITPPIFTNLDMFSQPTRKHQPKSIATIAIADATWNKIIPEPPSNETEETAPSFRFPSMSECKAEEVNSKDNPENSSRVSRIPSTMPSTPSQAAKFDLSSPKSQKLIESQHAAVVAVKENNTLIELIAQENENSKSVSSAQSAIPPSLYGIKAAAEKKPKLRLIDRNVTPVDGNSEVAPKLMDERREDLSANNSEGTPTARSTTGSYTSRTDEHQCIWKSRYMETLADKSGGQRSCDRENPDININGITVVLHLEGREDLIIKAESWKGGSNEH